MTELRHGYTLADLNQMTRAAVMADRSGATPYPDRWDTAWSAIAIALYEAEHWPRRSTLIQAGWTAIYREVRDSRRHHGYRDREHDSGLGSAPMFARYWCAPEAPWTDRLLDRIAAAQVHSALSDRDRQVLDTLAAFGDLRTAAAALGIKDASFRTYVSQARRRWLALWHDGETPRPPRIVRPHYRYDESGLLPCGTHGAYERHLRRREPVDDECAAAAAEYERTRRAKRKGVAA